MNSSSLNLRSSSRSLARVRSTHSPPKFSAFSLALNILFLAAGTSCGWEFMTRGGTWRGVSGSEPSPGIAYWRSWSRKASSSRQMASKAS